MKASPKQSTCLQLKSELSAIKTLQQEFELALDRARETGELEQAQALKAEIERKMVELREKLDPYNINLRKRLSEEYQLDFAHNFSEGLARVAKDNHYFYIDRKGRKIFKEK